MRLCTCGYGLLCKLPTCRCTAVTSCKPQFPKLSKKIIKVYIASFLAIFSNAFTVTMIFPFLPFMVEFLLPWLVEQEALVSTYAGIVASSMFLGRFFGSYIWGAISDRIGRKAVLVVSLVVGGISSAVFGFSVNYVMAVIARFLIGLSGGYVVVTKAMISEASDDSNQAVGVAILGLAYGLGLILGPAMSGVISDPIGQYNLTIENDFARDFLTRFPFFLPCCANFTLCIVSSIVIFFLLPETMAVKRNQNQSEISLQGSQQMLNTSRVETSSDWLSPTTSDTEENVSGVKGESLDADSELLIHKHSSGDAHSENNPINSLYVSNALFGENTSSVNKDSRDVFQDGGSLSDRVYRDTGNWSVDINDVSDGTEFDAIAEDHQTELLIGQGDSSSDITEDPSQPPVNALKRLQSWGQVGVKKAGKSFKESLVILLSFFCSLKPALSILVYCIYSFAIIGHNDIFSVWAKTSPRLGGLGFTLNEIGIILTVSGLLLLPFPLFLFPLVEKRLGLIKTFYVFNTILIPLIMLLPNVHYLLSYGLKWLLWILLCFLLLVVELCTTVGYSCQVLFINNSVTFDKLGSINGLTLSLTSIARCLSPIFSGLIYTASLSESAVAIGYPCDYRLVFVVFGLVYLLCVLIVACLPTSINKQLIVEDVN